MADPGGLDDFSRFLKGELDRLHERVTAEHQRRNEHGAPKAKASLQHQHQQHHRPGSSSDKARLNSRDKPTSPSPSQMAAWGSDGSDVNSYLRSKGQPPLERIVSGGDEEAQRAAEEEVVVEEVESMLQEFGIERPSERNSSAGKKTSTASSAALAAAAAAATASAAAKTAVPAAAAGSSASSSKDATGSDDISRLFQGLMPQSKSPPPPPEASSHRLPPPLAASATKPDSGASSPALMPVFSSPCPSESDDNVARSSLAAGSSANRGSIASLPDKAEDADHVRGFKSGCSSSAWQFQRPAGFDAAAPMSNFSSSHSGGTPPASDYVDRCASGDSPRRLSNFKKHTTFFAVPEEGDKGTNSASSRGFRSISITSDQDVKKGGKGDKEGMQDQTSYPGSAGNYEVLPAWINGGQVRGSRFGRTSTFMDTTLFELEDDDMFETSRFYEFMEHFIIHPCSMKRLIWDLLGLHFIAYDCVMVPMDVFVMERDLATVLITWTVRAYWTINLFLSPFLGFLRSDGVAELRFQKVVRRYLMTWFLLDLFVVGFDWLEVISDEEVSGLNRVGGSVRVLRIVRTVKLFRLLKAPEIAEKITEYIPLSEQLSLIATIMKIMLLFLWIAHLVGCLWFGLSMLYISNCTSCPTWILAEGIEDQSVGQQYTISLHWAIASLSGDTSIVDPANLGERVFSVCVLFVAFVVTASYVGSITTSMTRLQIITGETSAKLSVLRRFLLDRNISRPLAVRVQRNAQHAMDEAKRKAPESSVELLNIISEPVLVEVHFEIYSRILFMHPFMRAYNEINPSGVRKVCHGAISMLTLHTKDLLFSELEVPQNPRMYFVVSGRLGYQKQGKPMKYIEAGAWVSEPVLWTTWIHCGTCRAQTGTSLLALEAPKFTDVISGFPTEHAGLYALEFIEWLNDQGTCRDDIGFCPEMAEELIQRAFGDDDEQDEESGSEGSHSSIAPEAQSPMPGGRPRPHKGTSLQRTLSGMSSLLGVGSYSRQSSLAVGRTNTGNTARLSSVRRSSVGSVNSDTPSDRNRSHLSHHSGSHHTRGSTDTHNQRSSTDTGKRSSTRSSVRPKQTEEERKLSKQAMSAVLHSRRSSFGGMGSSMFFSGGGGGRPSGPGHHRSTVSSAVSQVGKLDQVVPIDLR